jgi:hypothetical protein
MFEPPLVFESIPPRPGDLKLSAAHSHPGKENTCGGEPVRVIESSHQSRSCSVSQGEDALGSFSLDPRNQTYERAVPSNIGVIDL